MKTIDDHRDFIIDAYVTEKKSTYEISQELGTYPNKIRRALKKFGVELRDKSSAQSQAIKSGRHKHPTKGKVRSEEERLKISEGMSVHWTDMDDQERLRRSEMAKKQWEEMTDEEAALKIQNQCRMKAAKKKVDKKRKEKKRKRDRKSDKKSE